MRFPRGLAPLAAILLLPPAFAQQPSGQPNAPRQFTGKPTVFFVGDVGLPESQLSQLLDPALADRRSSPTGGSTIRAYVDSGAWDKVVAQVKPGDFVLIEFGQNTTGTAGQQLPVAPSQTEGATRILLGTGDRTVEYTDPATHRIELVHSYGWYLRKLVVDVINHGGSPILCAPPTPTGTPVRPTPSAAQQAVTQEAVPPLPGAPALNAPPDTARFSDIPDNTGSTIAEWTGYIANEQRIPLLDLSASGANPDRAALRADLDGLKPDPLGPYLLKP